MTKGYWIARVDVYDLDAYKQYVAHNGAAFKKFGAKFLVRGGQFTLKEGTARSRNVLIEFPTYQAALDCYNSAEYKLASQFRGGTISNGDLVIIEGYDGPQPG